MLPGDLRRALAEELAKALRYPISVIPDGAYLAIGIDLGVPSGATFRSEVTPPIAGRFKVAWFKLSTPLEVRANVELTMAGEARDLLVSDQDEDRVSLIDCARLFGEPVVLDKFALRATTKVTTTAARYVRLDYGGTIVP
jgi:hypothetical protein